MLSTQSSPIRDLIVRDPVTISPHQSVRDALELMAENHVSGLPVLVVPSTTTEMPDLNRGRAEADWFDLSENPRANEPVCVGVVSASDILALEQEHTSRDDESLGAYFDSDTMGWENIRIAADDERLADITVGEIMSTSLIATRPDATVQEVARLMIESDVHRVLVLDEYCSLAGIVSTVDLVRLLAG